MRGQKRAATELLPTHREPKHARLMPENSAPNQAEGVIHNTLSSRWWQIGTELVNLMADTVVLVFGLAPRTLPTVQSSNGVNSPTISNGTQPSPPANRTVMAPPAVPPPPPRRSHTIASDAASTNTVVDSPPSSCTSEASTSRQNTPSPSQQLKVRRPERQHILATQHRARVQAERKREYDLLMNELYSARVATGYKSDFNTFKNYLSYAEQLERMEKQSVLSPSPSLEDLRSRPSTPALSRSHSSSDISSVSLSTDFMKRALATAKATLNEPKPPTPYAPSLDDLERAEREKDARINDRLRPKRIPLPSSLPAADEAQVAALMAKKGVIAKVARESVSNTDLARLRPGQWLNDEIINFYGAMIMERADGHTDKENRSAKGKGKLLDAYYFTSFFWAKLVKEGYEKGRLAKWTKKVDIFSKDVVLIPVNHDNMHWTAAAINFRRKRIESYDSMSAYTKRAFQIIRDYLDAEHKNKKKTPFDFTGWEDHTLSDTPQQENGYDCGVFTCQFLESLSRGEESFNFAQADIPYLRRRMIWEIGHSKLRED